jgi:hypothetical protein
MQEQPQRMDADKNYEDILEATRQRTINETRENIDKKYSLNRIHEHAIAVNNALDDKKRKERVTRNIALMRKANKNARNRIRRKLQKASRRQQRRRH